MKEWIPLAFINLISNLICLYRVETGLFMSTSHYHNLQFIQAHIPIAPSTWEGQVLEYYDSPEAERQNKRIVQSHVGSHKLSTLSVLCMVAWQRIRNFISAAAFVSMTNKIQSGGDFF